jgi:hypothetical protein
VVEYSTPNPKIEGSNPATGTESERKWQKVFKNIMLCFLINEKICLTSKVTSLVERKLTDFLKI